MPLTPKDIVVAPEDAGRAVRSALGVAEGDPLRISYVPGPGDLIETFNYWRNNQFDPRIPSIAYSTMFFEVCRRIGAAAQIVNRVGTPVRFDNPISIQFDPVRYSVGERGLAYRWGRFHYGAAIRDAVRRFEPHIIVVASDLETYWLPSLKRDVARLVYSMHNTFWPMGADADAEAERPENRFRAARLRQVDAALCTSHECARQFSRLAGGDIPTFVKTPQQIEPPGETTVKKRARRLVYLGRIEENKGVFDLLHAFKRLTAGRPDIRLDFAGDGGALPELREQIAATGLGDRVRALGRLAAADAHRALSESDLLVCPTRSTFNEGLAYVVFEAAVHGAPTVMSSVVPARNLMADGARVFPVDDADALHDCLAELIDDDVAFEALSRRAVDASYVVFDRSRSWGSQLIKALTSLK